MFRYSGVTEVVDGASLNYSGHSGAGERFVVLPAPARRRSRLNTMVTGRAWLSQGVQCGNKVQRGEQSSAVRLQTFETPMLPLSIIPDAGMAKHAACVLCVSIGWLRQRLKPSFECVEN